MEKTDPWNEMKKKRVEYVWVKGLPQVILSYKNNVQAFDFRRGESRHLNAGKNTDKGKF